MYEDDTTEETTRVNPECPDDGDPVRIETPEESVGNPRPAVDYHRPVALKPGSSRRLERR